MKSFEKCIEDYADLTIRIGVNIQQNQNLIIMANTQTAEFVRKVTEKAYDAGARNVFVFWNDEEVSKIRLEKASLDALKDVPFWQIKGFEELAKNDAAFLSIYASDPELLKNIDSERIGIANKTMAMANKEFKEYITKGKISWAMISVPTKGWANKVFADSNEEERIEKLWNSIFTVTRVYEENPVQAWQDHINALNKRIDYLNEMRLVKLHYKSDKTDLWVELPDKHKWMGADSKMQNGVSCLVNIPTEEVFTLPVKNGVNGILASTKPFNYRGSIIDDFVLTFKDGEIVDFTAKKGYDALKRLLEIDEGSKYLGEVALVPYDSPISKLNIIFYNTLYDENASCHFAFGNAYALCYENAENMSEAELNKVGVNTSLIHEDFMVGSQDLDIDGYTKDGEKIAVFKNGDWAI